MGWVLVLATFFINKIAMIAINPFHCYPSYFLYCTKNQDQTEKITKEFNGSSPSSPSIIIAESQNVCKGAVQVTASLHSSLRHDSIFILLIPPTKSPPLWKIIMKRSKLTMKKSLKLFLKDFSHSLFLTTPTSSPNNNTVDQILKTIFPMT